MPFDKEIANDIISKVLTSIETIEQRAEPYHCADDFLTSPTGTTILDSICMLFIAIGESLKGLDKVTNGIIFEDHPEIPWKRVKGLRDIIAHHYFEIDAEQIYWIIDKELQPLKSALEDMKAKL